MTESKVDGRDVESGLRKAKVLRRKAKVSTEKP